MRSNTWPLFPLVTTTLISSSFYTLCTQLKQRVRCGYERDINSWQWIWLCEKNIVVQLIQSNLLILSSMKSAFFSSGPSEDTIQADVLATKTRILKKLETANAEATLISDDSYSLATYLFKKSSVLKGYQQRYFILQPQFQRILYKLKPDSLEVKGTINLAQFEFHIEAAKNEFTIECSNRVYTLKADNSDILSKWQAALSEFQQKQNEKQFSAQEFNPLDNNKPEMAPLSNKLRANLLKDSLICADCAEKFDILHKKYLCRACLLVFCIDCIEPHSESYGRDRFCLKCTNTHAYEFHIQDWRGKPGVCNLVIKYIDSKNIYNPYTENSVINNNPVNNNKDNNNNNAAKLYKPEMRISYHGDDLRHPLIVRNYEHNIQLSGPEKGLSLQIYENSSSSAQFLGQIYIPLLQIEPNVLYEDFFPLQPRFGVKEDKKLKISGYLHLQIVLAKELLNYSDSTQKNEQEAAENAELDASSCIHRVADLFDSLQIPYYTALYNYIFRWEAPFLSLFWLGFYLWAVWSVPERLALAVIPFILLLVLMGNWIRIKVDESNKFIKLFTSSSKKKLALEKQQAKLNLPDKSSLTSNPGSSLSSAEDEDSPSEGHSPLQQQRRVVKGVAAGREFRRQATIAKLRTFSDLDSADAGVVQRLMSGPSTVNYRDFLAQKRKSHMGVLVLKRGHLQLNNVQNQRPISAQSMSPSNSSVTILSPTLDSGLGSPVSPAINSITPLNYISPSHLALRGERAMAESELSQENSLAKDGEVNLLGSAGGVFQRLYKLHRHIDVGQYYVDIVLDCVEELHNTVSLHDRHKARIALFRLTILFLLTYNLNWRTLLLLFGIWRWSVYLRQVLKRSSRAVVKRSAIIEDYNRNIHRHEIAFHQKVGHKVLPQQRLVLPPVLME
jgi:hypothetical protein